ncbi:hypothetical protein GF356_08345 [candidate division GN15 bacterium]|nr:hypothetical protein [candidate division GN15 bacterium]
MKRLLISLALVGLLLTAIASLAAGAGIKTERLSFDAEGATEIMVNLDFSAGELRFHPADISSVAEIEIRYDPEVNDYDAHYRVRGDRGYLDLESERRSDGDVDTEEHRWDIGLSQRYRHNLNMDLGAADIEMDLGGLSIEELMLDVGAASCDIDFSAPTKVRMREINIDAGASSLEMTNLGNARFDELDFSGGVGSFDLDFFGDFEGRSYVSIEVGMGTADIVVPEGLAVRLETEGGGWFSDVDFDEDHFRQVREEVWETRDFESAEHRLVLDIEVGMGAIDIRVR